LAIVLFCASASFGVLVFFISKYSEMIDRRLSSESHFKNATIYAESADTPPEYMARYFLSSRTKRRSVDFDQLPSALINAVLAGEDRGFFHHHGLSPTRIAGAALSDLKMDQLQGGSTITQQLARNLFLTPSPTLSRKVSEALIALILERRLNKKQIFTMYANEVYLGQRDSFDIHGFGEASYAYFGKPVEDLTLSEAATLAGVIPAPNAYSPVTHFDRAVARRNLILRILRDTAAITQKDYETALGTTLEITPKLDLAGENYLIDFARSELSKDYSDKELTTGGLQVFTTVDRGLQKAAADAVSIGLRLVEEELSVNAKNQKRGPGPQAGLIALDPHTGEIKAMVGGAHYGSSQYNRVTVGFRQPGSIFKPFVYAAALETAMAGLLFPALDDSGEEIQITPVTRIIDEPVSLFSRNGNYSPNNYRGHFSGEVTLRSALERSLNVPAVKIAELIGFDRVAQFAHRMGLNDRIKGYPSVALGAFEVTPMEIAGAYTVFANDGNYVEPHVLRQVKAADGRVLKTYQPKSRQVLSPQIAYLMTNLMQGVIDRGTGAGVRSRGFKLPAAGKTGTSRDGWFAGYTKDLLVVVWVGFDDGHDLGLEGARSALPIWTEFMKGAYRIYPPRNEQRLNFVPPPGIEVVPIDSATLKPAAAACPETYEEVFVAGTAPINTVNSCSAID